MLASCRSRFRFQFGDRAPRPTARAPANPNYKRPLILIGGWKSGQRSRVRKRIMAVSLSHSRPLHPPSPSPPCHRRWQPLIDRASLVAVIYVYTLSIYMRIGEASRRHRRIRVARRPRRRRPPNLRLALHERLQLRPLANVPSNGSD